MIPRVVPILLAAAWLAACGRGGDAPPPQAMPLAQGDGAVGWRGVLGCADCDGIETSLALSRAGERRNYLLVETYLTEDGGERFVDRGHWRAQNEGLIRLRSEEGGERVFAVFADGRLQPRDGRGRRFSGRDGDFLAPIAASNDL